MFLFSLKSEVFEFSPKVFAPFKHPQSNFMSFIVFLVNFYVKINTLFLYFLIPFIL